MMVKVECMLIMADGRREDVIQAVLGEIRKNEMAKLRYEHRDPEFNTTVICFVAVPPAMKQVLLSIAKRAAEEIDINVWDGPFNMKGALPEIWLYSEGDLYLDEIKTLGREIAEEFPKKARIPVAVDPPLSGEMRYPDPHPKAGYTILYTDRLPPCFFNVYVNSSGKNISKELGEVLSYLKDPTTHYGVNSFMHAKKGVCVSFRVRPEFPKPLYRLLESVRLEAVRFGGTVTSCELVGMVKKELIFESFSYYMRLSSFLDNQLLD